MGTSRNDPSPNRGSWKLVRAILGTTGFGPERQVQEIWRAAAADRHELLSKDYSNKAIAFAAQLAGGKIGLTDAMDRYDHAISEEAHSSVAFEFGRRALARCLTGGASAQDFAAELFSEATSYYVSRDLPSYVGAAGRVKNSTEAIALKDAIRFVTKDVIKGIPRKHITNWGTYIEQALRELQRAGRVKVR